MTLLNPLLLLFGLLAVPILALYMLKLRRREVAVSSTLLWQQVLRDRQANAPWQRLRRNLLLFLQLTILAALVLALARPALRLPVVASGSVVVLLDASASMNATDVTPSRFEVGRAAARRLIEGLANGAQMTLIAVKAQPQILVAREDDRDELRRALAAAIPSEGAANWETALALAAAAAVGSETVTTVIISDGGLPSEGLPPIPGEIRYLPIGHSGENLAVSALALRPSGNTVELFVGVSNYGDSERLAVLSLYRNGALLTAQEMSVPAGKQAQLSLYDLPSDAAVFQARLSPAAGETADVFPLDDAAFAVYQPPRKGRALVVTANPNGNFFLEQILTVMPGITPFRSLSQPGDAPKLPAEPFDLYVFDGYLPAELPEGPLLIINPPPTLLFSTSGVFSDTGKVEIADDPLTAYVDWSNVHVLRARQVQPPPWAKVLIRAEGGALVFAGEDNRRRIAVVTFDLRDSDLPLHVTFPILFANLLDYLATGQTFEAPDGLQPGSGLTIRLPAEAQKVVITSPRGSVYILESGEGRLTFDQTDELGVYAMNYLGRDSSFADFFAVNLFGTGESEIAPRQSIRLGRATLTAAAPTEMGQCELWPWLAALALAVAMMEWWVYHNRQAGKVRLMDKMAGSVR